MKISNSPIGWQWQDTDVISCLSSHRSYSSSSQKQCSGGAGWSRPVTSQHHHEMFILLTFSYPLAAVQLFMQNWKMVNEVLSWNNCMVNNWILRNIIWFVCICSYFYESLQSAEAGMIVHSWNLISSLAGWKWIISNSDHKSLIKSLTLFLNKEDIFNYFYHKHVGYQWTLLLSFKISH